MRSNKAGVKYKGIVFKFDTRTKANKVRRFIRAFNDRLINKSADTLIDMFEIISKSRYWNVRTMRKFLAENAHKD